MQGSKKGLRSGTLSQSETLAQSLASIAPTATPAMGIPFLLALSGNGSWLACLLALLAVACIAHQINLFAKRSNSSGSLYFFVEESLGASPSLITALALLIAYIATGCAVAGGFTIYAYSLLRGQGQPPLAVALALPAFAIILAGFLAYRDVHVSARLMLIIEAVSIVLILALFLLPGPRSALHFDPAQLLLQGVTLRQIRAGLVFSIFGFVGFESAASLGDEAVNPLKTIPRAITLTAWLSGLFFVLAAYVECYGFANQGSHLSESGAPLQLLANLRHFPMLGPLLGATTVCSFFACVLACITAASRILYKLSHDGRFAVVCGRSHAKHQTPHIAIFGISATILVVVFGLASARIVPFDIYGWAGTFGTYGFITSYLVVSAGSASMLIKTRRLNFISTISLCGSFLILLFAAVSSFDAGEGAYQRLPYIYLLLLVAGGAISIFLVKKSRPVAAAVSTKL